MMIVHQTIFRYQLYLYSQEPLGPSMHPMQEWHGVAPLILYHCVEYGNEFLMNFGSLQLSEVVMC